MNESDLHKKVREIHIISFVTASSILAFVTVALLVDTMTYVI